MPPTPARTWVRMATGGWGSSLRDGPSPPSPPGWHWLQYFMKCRCPSASRAESWRGGLEGSARRAVAQPHPEPTR